MKHNKKFDLIVVGCGHAGVEAAQIASARGFLFVLSLWTKKLWAECPVILPSVGLLRVNWLGS